MVVMPDADLDQAVDALIGAAYGSAGERCMAISVAVLVGEVAERVIPALAGRARQLRVGDGMEPKAEMGPVINAQALERVRGYIADGAAAGARLVVDGRVDAASGRPFAVAGQERGFWLGPTLFDRVTREMRIYQEEIFGPVLVCLRVPDFAAAIELVNSHPLANGVACYTRDGHVAREFGRRIQVGMVGINVPIPVPMAWHGFGGWKGSLFGDTHAYGEEGVRFYTRQKSIMERWPEATPKGPEFSMPTAK
jgi:malonate-semialdehyde dehydrogenase (acetylating)/methylmalonate-semialdehyde dehydrogenase